MRSRANSFILALLALLASDVVLAFLRCSVTSVPALLVLDARGELITRHGLVVLQQVVCLHLCCECARACLAFVWLRQPPPAPPPFVLFFAVRRANHASRSRGAAAGGLLESLL